MSIAVGAGIVAGTGVSSSAIGAGCAAGTGVSSPVKDHGGGVAISAGLGGTGTGTGVSSCANAARLVSCASSVWDDVVSLVVGSASVATPGGGLAGQRGNPDNP